MSDTRGEDDVAEFKTFFTKVLECFEKMEMKYVIVGGLAAILRGRARTTSDIDIIVEGKPELVMILLDNMERNGLVVMKEQARLAISEGTHELI
jgi:predicted nucleotidyltransferase